MNKTNYRTYTDEEVIRAISENITIADALRDLGLKITGGNYKTIKTLIVKLNIDTSHVLGKKRLKGKKCNDLFKKKPLSEIFKSAGVPGFENLNERWEGAKEMNLKAAYEELSS